MNVSERAIYCTWSHRSGFPERLELSFGDLDNFLRRLISRAEKSLTIIAPYLSAPGLQLLVGALEVCAEREVWLRIVTPLVGEPAKRNKAALHSLLASLNGTPLRHRVRVLSGPDEELFIHAKLIVADSKVGYIGSANLSVRGLDRNLELGVPLSLNQAQAVDQLVDYLESRGSLVENADFG